MSEPSDEALIGACRKGDDQAFATLVTRYQPMVLGLLIRSLGDRARAEELTQETFLRVYRGLPYFRAQARLSTWIYRIAVNLGFNERSRQRPEVALEVPRGWAPRPEPETTDAAFDALELRDRLSKALAQLTPHERLLVTGHYLRGIQYEALAEALDLPIGTVKTHLHRAKRKLRRLMEER
jgi:RNA polymerase sigma-70 factor, ECF subfamily